MTKPIVPPPYTAPTVGVEDLPELPDEFYEEEMIAAKGMTYLDGSIQMANAWRNITSICVFPGSDADFASFESSGNSTEKLRWTFTNS